MKSSEVNVDYDDWFMNVDKYKYSWIKNRQVLRLVLQSLNTSVEQYNICLFISNRFLVTSYGLLHFAFLLTVHSAFKIAVLYAWRPAILFAFKHFHLCCCKQICHRNQNKSVVHCELIGTVDWKNHITYLAFRCFQIVYYSM